MIIKYLFCSLTLKFFKFYLVFIRSMQLKKKIEQEQSFAGFDESFAGFDEDSAGFRQGSANYLGSNRILRGSWTHGPPPLLDMSNVSEINSTHLLTDLWAINSTHLLTDLRAIHFGFDSKGTSSVISSDPSWKEGNAWFTTIPCKHLGLWTNGGSIEITFEQKIVYSEWLKLDTKHISAINS